MSNRRTITVRLATPDDADAIIPTMRRAHEESPRPLPPVDYVWVREWGCNVIAMGYSWVAMDEDVVVGVLMCTLSITWTREPTALENVHMYVLPQYRRFGVAQRLLARHKLAAEATGLQARICMDYGGERLDAKERFVEREGYERVGGTYLYTPTTSPLYRAPEVTTVPDFSTISSIPEAAE